MAKILIVEDDQGVSFMIKSWLLFEHHMVEVIEDGQEADQHLKTYPYDLIILDWDLPNVSGVDICKRFRASGGQTPILMLTGKGTVTDKEQGLDSGADDYVPKPFHMKEVAARVRALLRRSVVTVANVLSVRDVTVEPSKYRVTKAGELVNLLPKEYALLEFLLRNPNHVFTVEELLYRVWKTDSDSGPDALKSTLKRLRKKIDTDGQPSIIRTVHAIGYVIDVP